MKHIPFILLRQLLLANVGSQVVWVLDRYCKLLKLRSGLQRSFVALLTVATHVNTGKLALRQHTDSQQLLVTRSSVSEGVEAVFAGAQ